MEIAILVVCGLIGGVQAGLLGVGGGLIYILILEIFLEQLGIPAAEIHQFVIANSILAVFFGTLSSSIKLYRNGEFYIRKVILVSLGSITASLLVLHFFVNTSVYNKLYFDYLILILLGYMLFRVFKKVMAVTKSISLEDASKNKLLLGGVAGGAIASLSGLGGGVIMVPIFNTMIGVDMKTARSVSLGVITITAFFMSINNVFEAEQYQVMAITQWGYILPTITLPMVGGVLVGGPLGVGLAKKMSDKTVSIIYAVFLLLFIIKKSLDLIGWL